MTNCLQIYLKNCDFLRQNDVFLRFGVRPNWPKVRPNRFGQNRPKVRPNRSVRSFTNMYVCKSIVIYVSVSYALYRLSPDKIISSFFIVKYFLAYDNISGVSNSKYSKSSYVLLYFIDICNSVEVFVKVHIPDGSTKCCLMKPYTTKTNYIYFFSEKTGNPGSL